MLKKNKEIYFSQKQNKKVPKSKMFYKKMDIINSELFLSNIKIIIKTLTSLPDISNWNTRNVTTIERMFEGCKGLKILQKNYFCITFELQVLTL